MDRGKVKEGVAGTQGQGSGVSAEGDEREEMVKGTGEAGIRV